MPNDNTAALVEALARTAEVLEQIGKSHRGTLSLDQAKRYARDEARAARQALAAHTPAEAAGPTLDQESFYAGWEACDRKWEGPSAAGYPTNVQEAWELASPVQAGLGDWVTVPRSLVYEAWSGLHAFANDATVDTQARLTKALTAPPAPDLQAQLSKLVDAGKQVDFASALLIVKAIRSPEDAAGLAPWTEAIRALRAAHDEITGEDDHGNR